MFSDKAILGAVATLCVGALGLFQWYVNLRAQARTRDHELFDWGSEVIDLMTTLEMLSSETVRPEHEPAFRQRCRELMAQASALIDKGRLFFPNVQTATFSIQRAGKNTPDRSPARERAYRGFRVKILDEVIRAFKVAKYLNANGPSQDDTVRQKMRASRRRFVSILQREMGRSLRRSSRSQTGAPVSEDPNQWVD